ncbi:uncharacterized protein [Procambarus clarkii]|uniref:uncharacterized protein isoform X2 n=1 Tax=Procambarus clarkii TaxID=6728 RepID=UPI003743991D
MVTPTAAGGGTYTGRAKLHDQTTAARPDYGCTTRGTHGCTTRLRLYDQRHPRLHDQTTAVRPEAPTAARPDHGCTTRGTHGCTTRGTHGCTTRGTHGCTTRGTHGCTTKMRTVVPLLTVALLAVCCLGAEAQDSVPCPDEVSALCPPTPGEYPEYFAFPDDCSKFCQCGDGGLAWELPCLLGLLWDDTLKTCNWPNLVDCGDRPIP